VFLICVPLKGKPLKAALHIPVSKGPQRVRPLGLRNL
jgi:hypothetical protein